MTLLTVNGISKVYREQQKSTQALNKASLTIRKNEFVSVIGPSGCGKSTLLNIIAGIDQPDEGVVIYDGQIVTGKNGLFGYMPQNDVLMPWRTVLDNVILGLELKGVPKDEARKKAELYFESFGLAGFQHKYPTSLSGGMRQRANFLRTILPDHPLLLLDEPFGKLDAITRHHMQRWLMNRWEELQVPVLLITHDIEEALFLSDRIYMMSSRPGSIKTEIDVPFTRPRSAEVEYSKTFMELKRKITNLL
ncbi:MAG: ABC transporter ATP-binding protein [Bacillaceae bacterium]|nr:ABC transporter ATP-binding protein [Bacillaceae bacterium]